jgi:hypothetical protein
MDRCPICACDDCGDEYYVPYRLPDAVWAKINGGFESLCPDCAHIAAELKGIELIWSVEAKEGG